MKAQGLSQRVRLVKGNNTQTDWFVRETMVGGKQGQGDVPLFLLNPNRFKDMVSAGLSRKVPGPGYIHFPAWLESSFFDELNAEVRDKKGIWQQIKPRNEALDLCYYIRALIVMLGMDKIRDWDHVPKWLMPLELNSEVIDVEARRAAQAERAATVPSVRAPTTRRVIRSSYLA